MNWLAHLLLSEPRPAFWVGSVLPDIVRRAALVDLPGEYQRGIARHHQVDRFTDAHAIVRRSISRIPSSLRRYGGILVDIFYDHFLAAGWAAYSPLRLGDFVAQVYASFESCRGAIPEEAYLRLRQIREGGWIGSYAEVGGIEDALGRLSLRLRRPFDVGAAMEMLREEGDALRGDFEGFFPELAAHVYLGADSACK